MDTLLPLSYSFFSLWSKYTLAHSPGEGGEEEGNGTKYNKEGRVVFFLYFYQRDCDESRLCISRMKVNM